MFSRLLNALFGWVTKSAVSKAEHKELSAERSGLRPNERKSGPPEHWLEAVRSAKPLMRGGSDEIVDGPATSEFTSKPSFETTSNGLHDLATKWAMPPAEYAEQTQSAQFEKPATTEVAKTAFVEEDRQIAESVQWAPAPKHNSKSVIARFFEWLTGSEPRKPVQSAYESLTDKPTPSARVLKFDPTQHRDGTQEQRWERPLQRERTALLTFPRPKDSRAIRQPAYEIASRNAPRGVQWAREAQPSTNWVEFGRGTRATSEAVAHSMPAVAREIDVPTSESPVCWPALSASRISEPAAFIESKRDLARPESQINSTTNIWPELPDTSARNDCNWRWMLRSVERSRRLDREQRGY